MLYRSALHRGIANPVVAKPLRDPTRRWSSTTRLALKNNLYSGTAREERRMEGWAEGKENFEVRDPSFDDLTSHYKIGSEKYVTNKLQNREQAIDAFRPRVTKL